MPSAKVLLSLIVGFSGFTGCSLSQLSQPVTSQPVADQQTEYWAVGAIHDGDTLRVQRGGEEMRIRLCGIDAPELEQPLGAASRDHLRSLLAGVNEVGVVPVEQDQYGRLVAEIFVPTSSEMEIHLNSQMVMDGMAYVYERYVGGCPNGTAISGAEEQAKAAGLGVWSGNQVPPWEYRQQNR